MFIDLKKEKQLKTFAKTFKPVEDGLKTFIFNTCLN